MVFESLFLKFLLQAGADGKAEGRVTMLQPCRCCWSPGAWSYGILLRPAWRPQCPSLTARVVFRQCRLFYEDKEMVRKYACICFSLKTNKQPPQTNKQTNPYYFPEFLTHSCNWSLSLAGFGCTQKSPGIFSGWAGMLFLLVASLPCKHFFLFSCIYLFVQTHSNPSVYLCMCALMSSRSYSFHPCKIV